MPYVESLGAKLYYEEAGTGEAIVFAHEFAADYRTWEGQIRRFSRDYRCVAYNARGYPPSDVPQDGALYGHEQQRDDLLAVMDGLGIETAHLVGLSMGAYTCLQFALKYPQRTRSVVFSSGGSGSATGDRTKFRKDTEEGAERFLRDGMAAGANGLALGATRVQLLNKDPRGWEDFRRYMSEHSALGAALTLKYFQALRPSLQSLEAELKALDIPVLLAVGDEDDPVIETNIFLKRVLPRAGLWMHPQTGHGINLEEPDQYNEYLARFFSAVSRDAWKRRDPRANPAQSVFMGDKSPAAKS